MSSILLLLNDPAMAAHWQEVIRNAPGLEVDGCVHTVAEARLAIARRTPDVLLADLQLGDGPAAKLFSELRANGRAKRPELLVAAASLDDPALMEALRQGADGYFIPGRSPDAMLVAIRLALDGESPMAPTIARQIQNHFEAASIDPNDFVAETQNPLHLGDTERNLLKLVAEGKSTTEIGRELERTVHGVGVDLRSMYRKLQFDVRAGALTLTLG
ncbi:MAG: response regulator transcription factor [Burkholderiaceae bacterium]